MNTGQKTGNVRNSGLNGLILNGKPDWDSLRKTDWFKRLYACPQEPDFHAEGNVGVHTEMVVAALLDLPEYAYLTEPEQTALMVAALLHDVAKPVCTLVEGEKISSPRHAKVGEKLSREILWDSDFELREQICSLVRLHGLPLWSLEKYNPWATIIGASLRVNNYLVYLLAKADVLGRVCADQDKLLERLEFFKEFCIENQCFDTSRHFFNTHSKFRYFFTDARYPADLFDDTKFRVELMSGVAGSGKDTLLKNCNFPIISLDDLRKQMKVKHTDSAGQGRVIQEAYKLAKKFCAAQQSFVWNSTNLTAELRAKLISTFSVYNPAFKITYVETSRENIFARREDDIPVNNLEKMIRILDMPLPTEAHEVQYWRND